MSRGPFSRSDPFRNKNNPIASIGGVTVMIRFKDGRVSAQHNVSNPWPYIIEMRKQSNVKSVWIDN